MQSNLPTPEPKAGIEIDQELIKPIRRFKIANSLTTVAKRMSHYG